MYVLKVALAFTFFSFAQGQGPPGRKTPFEEVDYNDFIGVWHSCLETSHMTFSGEAQEKHTHQNEKCRKIQMANITYVANEDGMDNSGLEKVTQILQLEHVGLNHCPFWGMSGATCPNATWAHNDRGEEGTVMYKQNFHGIGSYLNEHHVKFYGEEKHAIDHMGNMVRHKHDDVEDQDFFDCSYDANLKGLVCDTRQNEYRQNGGEEKEGWTSAYNDFGTYYLVKDMAQCKFCEEYRCRDIPKNLVVNVLGLGVNKKVTCLNVGKIEDEAVRMQVCDTLGTQGTKKNMKTKFVKEFCPNACLQCMD